MHALLLAISARRTFMQAGTRLTLREYCAALFAGTGDERERSITWGVCRQARRGFASAARTAAPNRQRVASSFKKETVSFRGRGHGFNVDFSCGPKGVLCVSMSSKLAMHEGTP